MYHYKVTKKIKSANYLNFDTYENLTSSDRHDLILGRVLTKDRYYSKLCCEIRLAFYHYFFILFSLKAQYYIIIDKDLLIIIILSIVY